MSTVFGVFCLYIFLLAVFWDVSLTKHVFHCENGISKENFFVTREFFLASQYFFALLFHNYCYGRKPTLSIYSSPFIGDSSVHKAVLSELLDLRHHFQTKFSLLNF